MEAGKLYACEEYHLMLYPDQETAAAAASSTASISAAAVAADPAAWSAFWSKRFGKPVLYVEKNVPLLVLKAEENFYEVLAGDKKGWIIDQDWLEIREIE